MIDKCDSNKIVLAVSLLIFPLAEDRLMALVDREYAGAEAWLERELVKQCGTWQQLSILKKKAVEERENPASCEGLTPSERLLWYRRNVEGVELDRLDLLDWGQSLSPACV